MFLQMTKPLRRIRQKKKAEEGELVESGDEEEEGQVKEEDGDDVAVVEPARLSKRKRLSLDLEAVEVNVEEVKVPAGKWRVVTKHVPENRLLIARYATGFDVRRGIICPVRPRPGGELLTGGGRSSLDHGLDGYDYSWTTKKDKERVRPGLNIFNKEGKELDWDYEHDTRFFEEEEDASKPSGKSRKRAHSPGSDQQADTMDEEENESATLGGAAYKPPEIVELDGGVKIRSRGRGAKKFFAFASSAKDDEEEEGDQGGKQKVVQSLASDEVE